MRPEKTPLVFLRCMVTGERMRIIIRLPVRFSGVEGRSHRKGVRVLMIAQQLLESENTPCLIFDLP